MSTWLKWIWTSQLPLQKTWLHSHDREYYLKSTLSTIFQGKISHAYHKCENHESFSTENKVFMLRARGIKAIEQTTSTSVMLCSETDWNIRIGKQGCVSNLSDFKKWCFDVSFLTAITQFGNSYFDTGKSWFFKIN